MKLTTREGEDGVGYSSSGKAISKLKKDKKGKTSSRKERVLQVGGGRPHSFPDKGALRRKKKKNGKFNT